MAVRTVGLGAGKAPDAFTSLKVEYAAAHSGTVIYDSSSWGRLRLTGSNRRDFLHRMSTNDIKALQAGQSAATILTTRNARIVDRVIVYVRDNDLSLLTSRGAQTAVADWLRQHIFFNDDVQVHDASGTLEMFSLYGAQAGEIVSQIVGEDVTDLNRWEQTLNDVIFTRTDPIAGDGFHLLAKAEALSPLWQAAIKAGATPIGEQTLEVLRIESGRPRYGHELSQDYIPLEVGLRADISFTKGCYIGQEIIARLESRQRLAKKMVGLRSSAPIKAGAAIQIGGSSVGKVTSAAVRPNGEAIALGFIKTPHAVAGKTVFIGAEPPMDAEIVTFPIL